MPTYVYRRDDGTTFEIQQRITEDALAVCPTTGQGVRRIPSASAGLVFKGSGFYLTDYKDRPKESGASSSSPKPDAGSGTTGSNDGAAAGTNAEGGTTTKTDTPKGD